MRGDCLLDGGYAHVSVGFRPIHMGEERLESSSSLAQKKMKSTRQEVGENTRQKKGLVERGIGRGQRHGVELSPLS